MTSWLPPKLPWRLISPQEKTVMRAARRIPRERNALGDGIDWSEVDRCCRARDRARRRRARA